MVCNLAVVGQKPTREQAYKHYSELLWILDHAYPEGFNDESERYICLIMSQHMSLRQLAGLTSYLFDNGRPVRTLAGE